MEIEPFTIIYFPAFYFKNGTPSKPKYFIALHIAEKNLVLASLPTSQDHVPDSIKISGCIDYPDKCISCFYFPAKEIICSDTEFSFPLDTFIYANEVDDYNLDVLKSVYGTESIDYLVKGELSDEKKKELINCLKNSSRIKRKIKKMLLPLFT